MSFAHVLRPISLALITSLFAAVASSDARARSRTERRNLLLITVESLRIDRLGCYAGGHRNTPVIDALAARGVRFSRAYTASPSTTPAVTTLLTGLYPLRHGIRHDLGGHLAENVPTLASTLQKAGYRTGAVVGSYHVDSDRGLDRGFGAFEDTFPGIRKKIAGLSKERRADEVVHKGLEFLDKGRKGQPFFLWMDFYDPHQDYAPPEPLAKQYESDPYAGELAYVDSQIGVFMEALRSRGYESNTHIVLAGSHGEGLGEHGEIGHGIYLFETTLRVPLIVVPAGSPRSEAAPGNHSAADPVNKVDSLNTGGPAESVTAAAGGRAVDRVVGLVDVAPTLLDLVSIEAPANLDGRSFASVLRGNDVGGASRRYFIEAVQPQAAYGWSPLYAVIDGDRKVVQGRRLEAFDLRADPGETKPLSPPPAWAADLDAFGRPLLGSLDFPESHGRQVLEAVEALGVPWAHSPFCVEKQNWPDPRDKVGLNDSLFRARVAFDQGFVGTAYTLSGEVLTSDPANFSALEMTVFLALRNGPIDTAVNSLEILQCNYPFRGAPYHLVAHYFEKQGELAKAERAFQIFADLEPWNEEPDYDLAALYASQGKKDLALDHLRKSIALGARDFDFIRKDGRFRTLRDDPRFTDLLGPVASPSAPAR